jgi:sulfopyruvate decarboxylase subunit beta
MVMDQVDMMEIVSKHRRDAVVIPIFMASKGWSQVSTQPRRDFSMGAMGKGSSIALGLALARPDIPIILFDGDGSLEMNLGSLVTVANKAPKNLYHFVIQNGVYAMTGGQPIPGAAKVSFRDMALAAGYANAYDFSDLEEFENRIEGIFAEDGPILICCHTIPDIRTLEQRAASRSDPKRRPMSTAVQELQEEMRSA